MIKEFAKLLKDNNLFDEYCKCILEISIDYGVTNTEDITWDDVVDCVFNWDSADHLIGRECDWSELDDIWRTLYDTDSRFNNNLTYTTTTQFVGALKGTGKKVVILRRLKYIK